MNLKTHVSKTLRLIVWLTIFVLPSVALAQDATDTPDGGLPRSESGQILFVRDSDVYVIDADGNNENNLTATTAEIDTAVWMPDGNQIIFSQAESLYLAQADGSNSRLLVTGEPESSTFILKVSPDETRLVWGRRIGNGGGSYYIVDIASASAELFEGAFYLTGFFEWSPDGTQLMYGTELGDIHIVTLSSGEDHLILKGVVGAWSPDGTAAVIPNATEEFYFGLHLVPLDGSAPQLLTTIYGWIESVSWSPDGSRIAYGARYREENGSLPMQIEIMDVESGVIQPFIPDDLRNIYTLFSWSPDGQQIMAKIASNGLNPTVYVADTFTGHFQQILVAEETGIGSVHWRP